jgi:glutamate/aspartate transport system substrate-binding protein
MKNLICAFGTGRSSRARFILIITAGLLTLSPWTGAVHAQAVSIASPPAGYVSALERIKQGQTIRLGYRTNSPPLSFERDGIAQGYTVDICRAAIESMAKKLQRKSIALTYVPVTIENRMNKVVSGEIDMECGLTTNTVSRAKQVAFSPSVLVTGTKIVVSANSSAFSLRDVEGLTVAAGKGTTNLRSVNRYASERGIRMKMVETVDTKAAFAALVQGSAAAAALNEISAIGWSREQSGVVVRLLDRYLSTEPVAICLPKHDPQFVRAISEAVSDVLVNGSAEQIYQRWLGSGGLGLPLNALTREAFRVPGGYSVPDELL